MIGFAQRKRINSEAEGDGSQSARSGYASGALSHRSSNRGNLSSRNGGDAPYTISGGAKVLDVIGFPENDNHENLNGYDMVVNSMRKEHTDNDQLNHLKKFHTLNSEHMTHRDHQDVKKQFSKVKEVIDPTGNAVFQINNQAPDIPYLTVEYIPKAPAIEHLNNLHRQHKAREEKYKTYASALKGKYATFEIESQRHYRDIIKRHQKDTDQLLVKKDEILYELKKQKQAAEREKKDKENELNEMITKWQKAKIAGKFDKEADGDEDEDAKGLEILNEDVDLETPVPDGAFDRMKRLRSRLQQKNQEWFREFKRVHHRDPEKADTKEIAHDLAEYDQYNKQYVLMKAKMIRQGIITPNFLKDEEQNEDGAGAMAGTPIQRTTTRAGFGLQKKMTRTGMGFASGINKQGTMAGDFASSKGFADAFMGDPSLKKLKEDIGLKELQNQQLADELKRLKYMLQDNVGENEIVSGLTKELNIKETDMKARDDEISGLIDEKKEIEDAKNALEKQIEDMKSKGLQDRRATILRKQTTKAGEFQSTNTLAKDKSPLREVTNPTPPLEESKIESRIEDSMVQDTSVVQEVPVRRRDLVTPGPAGARERPLSNAREEQLNSELTSMRLQNVALKEQLAVFKELQESLARPATPKAEAFVEDTPVAEAIVKSAEGATQPVAAETKETTNPEEAAKAAEAARLAQAKRDAARQKLTEMNDKVLAQTRDELTEKDARIQDLLEKLEGKEAEYAELQQNASIAQASLAAGNETAANITTGAPVVDTAALAELEGEKAELQALVDDYEKAVAEKEEKITELEGVQTALKDAYDERLAEKEEEFDHMKTDNDTYIAQLNEQIKNLDKHLKEQRSSGDIQAKGLQVEYEKQLEENKEQHTELQRRTAEVLRLGGLVDTIKADADKKHKEIEQLKGEVHSQKAEEELLVARMKSLAEQAGNAAQLAEDVKDLKKENASMSKELAGVGQKFRDEQLKRKNLLNELEDLKGKIRVYCRIRPFSKSEKEDATRYKNAVEINDSMSLTVHGRIEHTYNFDSVFGPESTQEQVFGETKRLIQSAIDGYNVCIFAYGQTGSGKTFTMQGSADLPGLAPRAIEELFVVVDAMQTFSVKLQCYMVEIYKGELRDLLLPKNARERPKLEVKQSAEGFVVVKNSTMREIRDMDELNEIFDKGLGGRQVRKTLMNEESSRSHLIFAIVVESTNKMNGKKQIGKLSFIDLAGSESSKKTGTDKEGQLEANAINQSLSALGNVIGALAEGAKFIRYQENLLTRLMRDSLGGNAKTLMFVNCSPSVYNEMETKNSLEYAKRVKEIKNNPTLNLESKALQRARAQADKQAAMLQEIKATFAGQEAEGIIAGIIKKFDASKEKHEEAEGQEEEKEGGGQERPYGEELKS